MMIHSPETRILAIAALLGGLIAANESAFGIGLIGTYAYWIARIMVEAAILIGFGRLIQNVMPALSRWQHIAMTVCVSLIPFVLIITAFDIVLGFPELDIENGAGGSRLREFALETLYLLDNHAVLAVILTFVAAPRDTMQSDQQTAPIIQSIDPPLDGPVIWAEAQEHYVRLTTDSDARMVLHRFSDIVKALPDSEGMQVHRSHWVAFRAIAGRYKDGTNLRLKLITGDTVPVSRSYRQTVETAIADTLPSSA